MYSQPVVYLGQTIERDIAVEFGDPNMGKKTQSGFAPLDRQGRQQSLKDSILKRVNGAHRNDGHEKKNRYRNMSDAGTCCACPENSYHRREAYGPR